MSGTKIIIPQQLYSSKNSQQIWRNKKTGKPFVQKSNKARQSFEDLCWLLKDAERRQAWQQMIEGREYPIRVQFMIYRKSHHRFDYTNIIQNLSDAMVKCGYIEDDDAKHFIPHFQPYQKDKDNPRVEITVLDTDL